MTTIVLHLASAIQYERLENVVSFVGEDDSGSFGILAGHARMVTTLTFGLARFRVAGEGWQYLAVPGAVLYFSFNQLYLSARRYARDADYGRINTVLRQELVVEEQTLHAMKQNLHRLEEEMFKRLWRMHRSGEPP